MQAPVPAAWLAPLPLACCPSAACTRHHLHGPLLAPALQLGVHAPLCTGLLLEPPCSQTHVPYFLTPAAHARGTAVLAGAERKYSTAAKTAETMHEQMLAFAATQGPCTLQSFGESCQNAVEIFNQAAEAHWHKMFALRMSRQHDTHSQRVLLQIACLDIDVSADLGVEILSESESVVAQLAVIVCDDTDGGDHFPSNASRFALWNAYATCRWTCCLRPVGFCAHSNSRTWQVGYRALKRTVPLHRKPCRTARPRCLWVCKRSPAHCGHGTPTARTCTRGRCRCKSARNQCLASTSGHQHRKSSPKLYATEQNIYTPNCLHMRKRHTTRFASRVASWRYNTPRKL